MLPCWDTVLHPFLTALDEGPIVEIGAASGETTAKLAELASRLDVTLHAIDPEPQFEPAELERRFDGCFRFHRERSLDVLEAIGPVAAAIVDGDHNWYTVHGELTLMERLAAGADRLFPLVFLHDVEWPYARRDMYYDPDAIPERWRKPWDRRGIGWGERFLHDEPGKGINPHLANAIEEGGPRNGVLTAVEDFLAESATALRLRIVRGEAGIGILVPANLLEANPQVRRCWDSLLSTEFLLAQEERLAKIAAAQTAGRLEARREIERIREALDARA